MASKINITVESDDSAVQGLVTKLNTLDLTTKEYAKTCKTVRDQLVIGSQAHIDYKNVVAQVAEQTRSDAAKMYASYFKLGEGIRSVETMLGELAAAYGATKFFVEASTQAARIKLLTEELDRLGKSKGFDAVKLMEQLAIATKGAVDNTDLLQIALKAIQLGNIDLNKLPAIMQLIQHQANLMGVDVRDMFDQFIKGAETGSSKFQIQFGLLYDLKKAEEDYAKSIGTTVQYLSDEEKRAVAVQVAFDNLLARQKAETSQAEQTINKFSKLGVVFDDVKETIGDLIGVPLSKFLLSVALEVAIAVEGLIALYHTIVGIGKAAYETITFSFDYTTAKEEFADAAKMGDQIRKQVKEIGDMWVKTEKDVSLSKEKIAEPPKTAKHVVGEAEAKSKAAEQQKLLAAQLKAEEERARALEWTDSALEKEAGYIQDAVDAGLLSTEQAIKELEILMDMAVEERERVRLLKTIAKLKEDQVNKDEKALRDIERAENERLRKLHKQYKELGLAADSVTKGIFNSFDGMAAEFSDAWQGMWARNIGNTKTLVAQLVQSIVSEFAALGAKLAAMQIFSWLFPSMGGFSNVVSLFTGRASGGDVYPGHSYVVGENGPEVLRLGAYGGTVIPNYRLSQVPPNSYPTTGGDSKMVFQTGEFKIKGNDLIASWVMTKQGKAKRVF